MSKLTLDEIFMAIDKLDTQESNELFLRLLDKEIINIPYLIGIYAQHLQDFKNNALFDMHILSQAGLELSEPTIKNIKNIKNKRRKELCTALAHTLIEAGGFEGTKHNDDLKKLIDTKIIDKSWYKGTWQLRTKKDTSHDQ